MPERTEIEKAKALANPEIRILSSRSSIEILGKEGRRR